MSTRTRRLVLGAVTAAGAVALLAGCSAAPSTTATAAVSNFLPCVVGSVGGFADHSFNGLALAGVTAGAKALGTSYKKIEAKTGNDYPSDMESLIKSGCTYIAAPGFDLVAAVKSEAAANPKINFAMIDDNSIKAPNVKDIVYSTDEAAFIGGYIAAAYSKTGVVATWGGAEYPSVTLYMDGFVDGVKYYNDQKKKNVQVLGWDETTQKGTFIGNFTDQTAAKTVTQNFLDQKADVIVPVAGTLYEGAAAAIESSGADAVLEGVDADLYYTDPKYQKLMLTSILKNIDVTVTASVKQAASSKTFDNSQYVGTLKNNGVGIAPFHDFASKVPSSLSGEIAKIKAGIEDGSITVATPSGF